MSGFRDVDRVVAIDLRDRPTPGFEVAVIPARERVLLRAVGELDLASAPKLRAATEDLRAAGFDQLVIDLRQVTFIDLVGVRLLVGLAEASRKDGWQLSLTQGGRQVLRMLALTGARSQLPMCPGDAVATPGKGYEDGQGHM
jgi:anti-anti-sigma factor